MTLSMYIITECFYFILLISNSCPSKVSPAVFVVPGRPLDAPGGGDGPGRGRGLVVVDGGAARGERLGEPAVAGGLHIVGQEAVLVLQPLGAETNTR